ncbi:MAG: GAF domain-containing protein [Candidatus Riflebacteria bacterium]|nr:GAF domain-containing protein [Candidatus Riflebacteria bacterium]
MVKKIFLEEIVDRENLKTFIQRLKKLSRLEIIPFNEKGEPVIGDPTILFGKIKAKPMDFETLANHDFIERPDGGKIHVVRLSFKGHLFGLAVMGPYFLSGSATHHDNPSIPVLSEEQLSSTQEMIEEYFLQQLELAAEREELRRKEKIFSVLEEASNIMNSSLEFMHVLEFLMDIAIDITGATCGALLLKKEGKKYLEVAVARGNYPQEVKKIRVPIGKGITGWVAKFQEPLIVPNVLLEPRYIETPETIYSELAVPLMAGEKLIGVLAVDSSEINAFSKEDSATLSMLASMVTKVLENSRLLAASNQQICELSNLFAISEKLLSGAAISVNLETVLKDIASALNCLGISLMKYDSDREELSMNASYGLPEETFSLKIPLGKGIHGWVAQQKKPLLIVDVVQEPTLVRYSLLDQFSRSTLSVPLLAGERLIGVLSAFQKADNSPFREEEEPLLINIGRNVTAYFENQRLFEDSKRKLNYLSTLYQVSSSVSRTLNLNKVFNATLQQVQEVMNVENCSLMAFDPLKERLTLDAAIGVPKKLVGVVQIQLGEGIAGWVAKNRQPVLIKDISKDPRFFQHGGKLDYKTRSALSVPITHNKTLLGVINVNNKRSGGAFNEEDLNLLIGISGQIAQAIANANLYERTEQQVAELSMIQELGKAINSSLDLDSVLNYFIDMTSRITESDRSTLMLYDEEQSELFVQVFRGFNEEEMKNVRMKFGEGIAGQVVKSRKPIKVINSDEDSRFVNMAVARPNKGPVSMISAPLLNRDQIIGVINCERDLSKKLPFPPESLDLLDTLGSQASVAIENARLYHNLLNVYLETIRALAAAIDAKDSYTHGHSRRVTDLSVSLAMAMGLRKSEVDTIRHAALLHDVGKIGISERILLKPGRLTDDEFETIKSHPHIGAGILNSIEFLKNVCCIIEHHHERFDGKGYPSGLKGDEIPLGARIIMVSDSFDAITSTRPYRKPLTFREAMDEINRCVGTQFDPTVVEAFISLPQSVYCPDWLKLD